MITNTSNLDHRLIWQLTTKNNVQIITCICTSKTSYAHNNECYITQEVKERKWKLKSEMRLCKSVLLIFILIS